MTPVIAGLFFVLFPAAVIYACHKNAAADKIGAAGLCFGCGILLSVLGLVPTQAEGVMQTLLELTVPLAIPLMLFSMDLRRWWSLAGATFLSLGLVIASALISSAAAFLLLGDRVQESWKISGMLIGMYTGGTPNLNAIGLALKVDENVLVLTNTADMLLGTLLFFFYLLLAQRVFGKILPPFSAGLQRVTSPDVQNDLDREKMDFTNYQGIFKRDTLLPLLAAFGLSLLVFAVGVALFLITPEAYNMAVLMLSITTLGILCSFVRRVREIRMTFQLGQYFILIFCLTVGAMADISRLFSAAALILAYTSIILFGSVLLHLILSALFRIDVDTMIITSTAAIYSPPLCPGRGRGAEKQGGGCFRPGRGHHRVRGRQLPGGGFGPGVESFFLTAPFPNRLPRRPIHFWHMTC